MQNSPQVFDFLSLEQPSIAWVIRVLEVRELIFHLSCLKLKLWLEGKILCHLNDKCGYWAIVLYICAIIIIAWATLRWKKKYHKHTRFISSNNFDTK